MDTSSTPDASPDLTPSLSGLLAAHPTVLARLIDQHTDDGTGHCGSCDAQTWPCRLREMAETAQQRQRGHQP